MKNKLIIAVIIGLVAFSCSTIPKKTTTLAQACPEGGVCRFEQLPAKSLNIKKDDTAAFYYQIENSTGKTVFQYFYERNKEEAYLDGHYIEEVVFEIDSSALSADFDNQKPNHILFGVFCYCKGKAGYYQVEEALVSFDKKHKKISVQINGDIIGNQILNAFEFFMK